MAHAAGQPSVQQGLQRGSALARALELRGWPGEPPQVHRGPGHLAQAVSAVAEVRLVRLRGAGAVTGRRWVLSASALPAPCRVPVGPLALRLRGPGPRGGVQRPVGAGQGARAEQWRVAEPAPRGHRARAAAVRHAHDRRHAAAHVRRPAGRDDLHERHVAL